MTWTLCRDAAELAETACRRILHQARRAIARRGCFKLVLAGGSTPEACYRRLAECDCDWDKWHLYFGDERCLPAGDPRRNSEMVAQALLQRAAVPDRQVHPIPAERGAATAASEYSCLLEGAYPFDLVLLGLGEDGHTASLFPGAGQPAGAQAFAVYGAPKPPPERVSLSAAALSNSRHLLFLVSGCRKRDAVARWRDGEPIPAAAITAMHPIERLVDRAAWGTGRGQE